MRHFAATELFFLLSFAEMENPAECINHRLRINRRLVSGSFLAEERGKKNRLLGLRLMFTRQCYQSDMEHHGANVAEGLFSYDISRTELAKKYERSLKINEMCIYGRHTSTRR